jgi:N-acetylmuramoyl-L-alanine amidase
MRGIAALAISVSVLMAQSERPLLHSVTAVRHWSSADVTRVAIEVTGDFKFHFDRLHNPERVYFDIRDARPRFDNRRTYSETIGDKLLQSVRVAETAPGVTRVVLDLAASVEIKTSQLANPNRLMIELRAGPAGPTIPTTAPVPAPRQSSPPPGMLTDPSMPPKPPPAIKADAAPPALVEPYKAPAAPAKVTQAQTQAKAETPEKLVPAPPVAASPKLESESPALSTEIGKAARHTSTGSVSLVRALGLKVGRVVIDPGHGGHDQGTEGPHGLLEKDLVLDVAKRVGKLIEDRMGAEVIYTRTDDTFIPLEGRTALANDKKADLFLSIHANSSPVTRIAGVETWYMNFNPSKEAMDIASRENATSQKSIFDLQEIVQKITLHDKVEESREFAGRVQAAMYAFSARNFPAEKNRGVKKAPFVVLIGATMPSVLAEIGFVSNTREEALLKKPDYRQKLAEALYRGISRYAETLSHFQVAKNQ